MTNSTNIVYQRIKYKFIAALLFVCISQYSSPYKASCAEKNKAVPGLPTFPQSGSKIEDFVPPGWKILQNDNEVGVRRGDLNGDGLEDIVFILQYGTSEPQYGYVEEFDSHLRPLVILHGKSGGKLELACLAKKAIMYGSQANEFALGYLSLSLNDGVIVIEHGNGSTSYEHLVTKYRYQNDGYYLIGYTNRSGSVRGGNSRILDSNLNTGLSTMELSRSTNMKTGYSSSRKKYTFYSLRAGKINAIPDLSKLDTKMKGPVITRKNAKYKSSARLQAVHDDKNLYVLAEIEDMPGKSLALRLAGKGKKLIEPAELVVHQANHKEKERKEPALICQKVYARFPLSALESFVEKQGGMITTNNRILDSSIQIIDKSNPGTIISSTSINNEWNSGQIRLTGYSGLAKLKDWNWETCDW